MELKGQVFILGMGNLFEVWNPEAYHFKSKELEQGFSGNRNYVAELLEKRKHEQRD
jgi:DNA-binding transcriptional regulator/RsmH inhibitor MraZ